MGRTWDTNEVSDSRFITFPRGRFCVEIAAISEEADKNGLLFYPVALTIHKPAEFGGLTWTHFAYVGTHADPDAEEVATRRKSPGLKLLKRICASTDVVFGAPDMCEQLADKQFIAENRPELYNEELRNKMVWAYAIGEAEPEILEDRSMPSTRPATVAKGGDGLARSAGFVATTQRPAAAFGPVQVFDE